MDGFFIEEKMAAPALAITGLSKSFGGNMAVDNVDLTIAPGQFHALLGPNGAGKTTTLRIVAGLLKPDAGRVAIFGHDTVKETQNAKRITAFLPDDPMLYGKLNPLEYLEFVAGLWTIDATRAASRAEDLLKWLELWDKRFEYTEGFSRGMRQKLALAGALIHEPKLMILDEPLTGLDAHAAKSVKDMLVDYVAKGNTVVLTTHILDIAERLAERISIIQQGRIVAEGTLEELRAKTGSAGASLEDVFLNLTQAA